MSLILKSQNLALNMQSFEVFPWWGKIQQMQVWNSSKISKFGSHFVLMLQSVESLCKAVVLGELDTLTFAGWG